MSQEKFATELLVSGNNYLILRQDDEDGIEREIWLTKEQASLIADEMETLAAMKNWEPGKTFIAGEY